MGALWDFTSTINAQRDERQDNRNYSQANAYTYAPIIAFESSVWGNEAGSSATAKTDSKQSKEDGFTGGNAQNVLVAGVVVTAVVLGATFLLKK